MLWYVCAISSSACAPSDGHVCYTNQTSILDAIAHAGCTAREQASLKALPTLLIGERTPTGGCAACVTSRLSAATTVITSTRPEALTLQPYPLP